MRVHVLVCLAALAAAPALAQEAPLTRVYACTDVADATARLACFDAAVAGLKQQQAGGDLAVVSRQQVLPQKDPEVAAVLEAEFLAQGVHLLKGARAESILRSGSSVLVHCNDGRQVDASHVVLAIGSIPSAANM